MPRDVPESRDAGPRTSSAPASAGHSNVVVSRSTVRRKPVGRTRSGDTLTEMRRGGMERNIAPNTPMSNRHRMTILAAMEMSMHSMGSDADDGTINSNTSSGSISLKSPGGRRDREREREDRHKDNNDRRRRSSSQAARGGSIRNGKSPGERGGTERPPSSSSLQGDEGGSGKLAESLSSRSERRVDRSRPGGKSSSSGSGNKQRSASSGRRNEGGRRSNSLNEKRNGRSHRMATSKALSADTPPKSTGCAHRSSVTEDEILELLSLDYLVPLTPSGRRSSGSRTNKESNGCNNKRGKEMNTTSRHSNASSRSGNTRERRERSDRSPSSPIRDRSLSIDRIANPHSQHKRRSGESSTNRDSRDTRELDLSNSTGSLERKTSTFSAPVGGRIHHRTPPRRTKSDDHGLDNFLQQSTSISRRIRPGAGSRSVASTPTKVGARRRRGSVGGMSDRTDATEDTTKPSSSSYAMSGINDDDPIGRLGSSGTIHHHHHDLSDEENDHANIDLDLATASRTFQEQKLNEKLQLHLTKTDELLYSVFPKHVADALRNGQKVEPENHDLVTIFFSDIVGFTDISSKLDPMKISDLLDRLYHSFDALSDYHDVFKVETYVIDR
jgi:Adenylate and Guanylate cyclase catalytic domain